MFGFIPACVYRRHTDIAALLAGMAEVNVVIPDFTAADAWTVAEMVAEAVCGGVGTDEVISPGGTHS
jgi:hypothetical protein